MMISTPIPAMAAAPAAPPAPDAPPPTATPVTAPAAPAPDDGPPPAGAAPKPGDDPSIPTKEQAIAETMSMSAQDAAAAVASNFDALGKLTVGGGTKEGAEHAKLASMLLTNSSNMLQLAHLKASEHLRSLADELDMQMMSSATNLAFLGGQIALAGSSAQPVRVAELAAEPIARSSAALAGVLAMIQPATAPQPDGASQEPPTAPGAPATDGPLEPAPAPTPGSAPAPTPDPGPGPAPAPGPAAGADPTPDSGPAPGPAPATGPAPAPPAAGAPAEWPKSA